LDIIYNIGQFSENKILFNYTVNSDTPVFILVFTNPWTAEEKTVTLNTPDGTDGEWIFNIEGVGNEFEDLDQGKIEFEIPGTWAVSVSESGTLIKNINLQVIEEEDNTMGVKIKEQTITSAQILTGFDSPVELVGAPGANKLLVPILWNLFGDFNSVAYADNIRWGLFRGTVSLASGPSDALDFVLDEVFTTGFSGNAVWTPSTDHINQPLFFQVLIGNPTAGNSPLLSSLLYEEIDFGAF